MSEKQFDRLGENYYNIKGGHVHLYYTKQKVAILKKIIKPDFSVLDVGCGVGQHAKLLIEGESCKQIYGMDYSRQMVKSANKNMGRQFALRADALAIPFKDSSFDVVYTSNLLHHLIEREKVKSAVQQMARVSKKYLIIFEFNSQNPFCKYFLFKICPYDTGNERIPTKKEIIQIAKDTRLVIHKIIHKSFMPMFTPKSLMPLFSKIERILEKVIPWISVGMVYVLEKHE